MATHPHTIEELRRERNRLANVLVHDCDPRSEECYCFGQADIDAYEAAKARLAQAREAGCAGCNGNGCSSCLSPQELRNV